MCELHFKCIFEWITVTDRTNKWLSCLWSVLLILLWKSCILVSYRFFVSILVVSVGQDEVDAPYTILEVHRVPVLLKLVYLKNKHSEDSYQQHSHLYTTTTWPYSLSELPPVTINKCDMTQVISINCAYFFSWQNPNRPITSVEVKLNIPHKSL